MSDYLPDAQGKPDLHNAKLYGGARPEPDEIEDRRQRARKAAHDEFGGVDVLTADSLDTAIETATQVKITPEALAAMNPAVGDRKTRLRAALQALGFEVIE